MKQFGKILNFELKNYLKNKAFVGVTIFLVVIIAVVMFFPRITSLFESGDSVDVTDDLPILLVKAEDPAQAEMVQQTFAAAFIDYDVQVTSEDTAYIKEQITSGNAEGAFVMTGPTSYTYYVNNLSMYDANEAIANEVLQQIYQINAMIGSGMTPEQAGEVMNIQITSDVEMLGKDQMQNFFYTYIMIFALYMVILLYGQMVAMNVATEKSSRAMEVLITSAKVEGQFCVAGYDHVKGERFLLPFVMVPVFFSGTGDIFSGILTGRVLDGQPLQQAVQSAMDAIRVMILRHKENEDHYVGIPIETCLDVLN